MTALILLNGSPGIGKSTLAARYADRHPGTLDLDIDTLHFMIGGWRELGGRVHDFLRPLALGMAATHLAGGHDVIVPQYVARAEAAAAFDQVAEAAGAELVEIVLMDERNAALDRFDARPDDTEWAAHNRTIVGALGGRDFLAGMYDQLRAHLAERPAALTMTTIPGDIEATYAALIRALDTASAG